MDASNTDLGDHAILFVMFHMKHLFKKNKNQPHHNLFFFLNALCIFNLCCNIYFQKIRCSHKSKCQIEIIQT